MVTEIKKIVENYINNRQMTRIVIGNYREGRVELNEKAYVPDKLLTGNLRDVLRAGDKVRLLRNEGGGEYYILEIIGAPVRLQREERNEDI